MRVFVTGASGFIGSNVVRELQAAGHQITGLARSEKSAAVLEQRGVAVIRGDIADTELLQRAARDAEGTIHCAFNHDDLAKFVDNAAIEERALDALTGALEGSNKPLVISGGVLGVATEGEVQTFNFPRIAAILRAVDASKRGVRTSLIRNAPVTHGPGDVHGFAPTLIATARAKGIAGYVEPAVLWPASHVRDTAVLYRLAFEKAPAGSVLHAVGDEGVSTRTIAETIGKKLGVPVQPIANPVDHFGPFFAQVLTMGGRSSNAITRKLLDWQPTHPGLIEDLESGVYA